jgi:hypothetical protein
VDPAVAVELSGGPPAAPPSSAAVGGGTGADDQPGPGAPGSSTPAGRFITVATPPPIRPGDPLFLRFRKYLYERKDKDVPRAKLMVQ